MTAAARTQVMITREREMSRRSSLQGEKYVSYYSLRSLIQLLHPMIFFYIYCLIVRTDEEDHYIAKYSIHMEHARHEIDWVAKVEILDEHFSPTHYIQLTRLQLEFYHGNR